MNVARWALTVLCFTSAALPAFAEGPLPADGSTANARVEEKQAADLCAPGAVASSPTRPTWDTAAAPTQCGVLELDSGWIAQAIGRGIRQNLFVSSLRYGLTPKFDLDWQSISRVTQDGGVTPPLAGVGDQSLTARFNFRGQTAKLPAMAVLYAFKIPTANPAKGFGTGFADHAVTLVASRDLGRNHFDFNAVGTLAGAQHGHDAAAQFGLALTRPATRKLFWIIESYGGSQPGTPDRFGAALAGGSFVVRPNLVLDGAYSRTYTAGSPREQFLFGFTYAIRPGFAPVPRSSALARLLGR